MPGQATVTIKEDQWNVWVATTPAELTAGLSGVESIPAGTGMLFVLPAEQPVTVDTSAMLFPIDIIFISENLVVDVASDIQPGYLVTEETPCDMFLEVNAGEAAGVEAGDAVTIAIIQPPGFGLSQVMSFAIPVAALGFVCAMAGGMAGLMGGSSSPKQLSAGTLPQTTKETYYWTAINKETGEIVEYATPQPTPDGSLKAGKTWVTKHWRYGIAVVEVWGQPHRYSESLKIEPVTSETVTLGKSPAVIPTGTCYEDAWRFLIKEEEGELIHGTLFSGGRRMGHAWVETETGYVWEPETGKFFTLEGFNYDFAPVIESRYTAEEAAIMAARTNNLGPWTEQERRQYLKDKSPAVIPTEPAPRPPRPKDELEFVADSPEFLAYTIQDIGYREKLDTTFHAAIARAKGAG